MCRCEKYDSKEKHKEYCRYIHEALYLPKNEIYGDSFHKMYEELGVISAVTQISHKYNRLVKQSRDMENGCNIVGDVIYEGIQDTILDLANYCILTAMEIERERKCKCKKES